MKCKKNFPLFDTITCYHCKENCPANKNFYIARDITGDLTTGYLLSEEKDGYLQLLTRISDFTIKKSVLRETLERLH